MPQVSARFCFLPPPQFIEFGGLRLAHHIATCDGNGREGRQTNMVGCSRAKSKASNMKRKGTHWSNSGQLRSKNPHFSTKTPWFYSSFFKSFEPKSRTLLWDVRRHQNIRELVGRSVTGIREEPRLSGLRVVVTVHLHSRIPSNNQDLARRQHGMSQLKASHNTTQLVARPYCALFRKCQEKNSTL